MSHSETYSAYVFDPVHAVLWIFFILAYMDDNGAFLPVSTMLLDFRQRSG